MKEILQVRGFAVGRGIELRYCGQCSRLPCDQVSGYAEVGLVLVQDDGKLDPITLLFVGEPVCEILIVVKSTRCELRRLADFAFVHFSEFKWHKGSVNSNAIILPLSQSIKNQ